MTIEEAIETLDSDDLENLKDKYAIQELQEAIDTIVSYAKIRI